MSPRETVLALFDAFARRDLDAAVVLLHPDLEFWPQGTAERVGRQEPYRGVDGIRAYFADVAAVWESLRVEPGELRVAGRGVVAFGVAVGRAGGEDVRVPVIWVFKLRDDRIVSGRVVKTAAEAFEAAGTA